jgi:hypothetical protein
MGQVIHVSFRKRRKLNAQEQRTVDRAYSVLAEPDAPKDTVAYFQRRIKEVHYG